MHYCWNSTKNSMQFLCLKICGVYNFLQYLVFQYHLMAVNMDRKPRECLCVPDINYSCPAVKFLACLTNPFWIALVSLCFSLVASQMDRICSILRNVTLEHWSLYTLRNTFYLIFSGTKSDCFLSMLFLFQLTPQLFYLVTGHVGEPTLTMVKKDVARPREKVLWVGTSAYILILLDF